MDTRANDRQGWMTRAIHQVHTGSFRSDELDDDVSREDLFSYLQSHLDSVCFN